jgi:hypothetical protein
MTIFRSNTITGLPERMLSWQYGLQTASGEPLLHEGGGGEADSGSECTTNLGVHSKDHRLVHPGTGHPATDLKYHMLRMGQEEVSLWCSGAWSLSSLLTLVRNEVIPAWCQSGNCTAGGSHGGSKQPMGTKSEDFPPRRTVHSWDLVHTQWKYLSGSWMCATDARYWLKAPPLAAVNQSCGQHQSTAQNAKLQRLEGSVSNCRRWCPVPGWTSMPEMPRSWS